MTVVIADSSPLNYLTLIGSVDVLHAAEGPNSLVQAGGVFTKYSVK